MRKYSFLLFLIIILSGCTTKSKVQIIIPNGSPVIAFGNIIKNEKSYEFDIVTGPDLLVSAFTSKSHDVIVAPITLGAKLIMNNNTDYQMYAILTSGNNYIISKSSLNINDINDLKNAEIYAYGQNNVPDIILRKVLNDKMIQNTINYEASVDALVSKFICDTNNPNQLCKSGNIILSAEPTISQLKLKYNVDFNIIDLQEEFRRTTELDLIPQAAIFINPKAKNINQIKKLFEILENNIEYLNQNPKEYANSIVSLDYLKNLDEEVIAKSIPGSSIVFIKGKDNRQLIENYFKIINEFNPNILNNKVPGDNFYYE